MVDWSYYDKFDKIIDKYLPARGEGETLATQFCTAVNKLVYKYYNDGDIFDNSYYLTETGNDLSSYANWIAKHSKTAKAILERIEKIYIEDDYEDLLADLADEILNEDFLSEANKKEKHGSIYNCAGQFHYKEWEEEEWEEEDEEEWEEKEW